MRKTARSRAVVPATALFLVMLISCAGIDAVDGDRAHEPLAADEPVPEHDSEPDGADRSDPSEPDNGETERPSAPDDDVASADESVFADTDDADDTDDTDDAADTDDADDTGDAAVAAVDPGEVELGPLGRIGHVPFAPDPGEPADRPPLPDDPDYFAYVLEQAHGYVSALPLERQIGQMLMPAYILDARGRPVLDLNDRIQDEIEAVQPGGILLFGQNIRSVEQVRRMTSALQQLTEVPLFIAADQEGGLVSRITQSSEMTATRFPSAAVVGRTGDVEFAFEVGRAIGRELRALGINMNLAPVADILTNPSNTVIGTRAFGSDPDSVAAMVVRMVEGLQVEQVSSVVKHFPGHGDSGGDSHTEVVELAHDLQRLESIEFIPFRRAVAAGVDGVMTAHVDLPNLLGSNTPVTLSSVALQDLLRGALGFQRLIVTDSLVMQAVTSRYSPAELAVRSVEAGADVLLQPRNSTESRDALISAVESGRISESRIAESAARIVAVKYIRGLFGVDGVTPRDPGVLGSDEHADLVRRIRRSAQ